MQNLFIIFFWRNVSIDFLASRHKSTLVVSGKMHTNLFTIWETKYVDADERWSLFKTF